MAAPTEFITIDNFSGGIWSDIHASENVSPQGTPTLTGVMPGNGIATMQNTYRCRADRTGALIPLPKATTKIVVGSVIPTSAAYASNGQIPTGLGSAYLLDAQIGPLMSHGTAQVTPGNDSVFTMWGFYWSPDGNGVATGDYAYVLGREYRQWSTNLPILDFAWARTVNRTQRNLSRPLPTGQLASMRLYTGAAQFIKTQTDTFFHPTSNFPVVACMMGMPFFGDVTNNDWQQSAIPGGEIPALVQVNNSAGTLVSPMTYFSPGFTPTVPANGQVGACIGANITPDGGAVVGSSVPGNLGGQPWAWSWHTNDQGVNTATVPNAFPGNPYFMTTHQGRLIIGDRRQNKATAGLSHEYIPGTGTPALIVYAFDDYIFYSDFGLPLQDDTQAGVAAGMANYGPYPSSVLCTQYNATLFGQDVVSNSGCMGTVTNDQFLIVKHKGGGVLVSGDFDNPIVRRLAMIESTHGVTCKGAQTPIGFVYGSRLGIYTWQGGDTSKCISPQMDGFFWDHTQSNVSEQYAGARGRITHWAGLICVPNSFVYDLNTQAWWRLHDQNTVPYNIYDESPDGILYAFPYKSNTVQTTVAVTYDQTKLDAHYSWQSHPLNQTRGRSISVQNIKLVTTGFADTTETVTVTLTGFDERGVTISSTTVFNLAATGTMQILRKDIAPSFQAEYIQVRIQSDASNNTKPAPKVHSIQLGIGTRSTTPRNG